MGRSLYCLIAVAVFLSLPVWAEQSSEFSGQPKFKEGDDFGYFVWKEGDKWKVRWTTYGKMRHFSGRVVAKGGDIKSLDRIDVETERRIIRPGHRTRVVRGPMGKPRVVVRRPPIVEERRQDVIKKESDREITFTARTDDDIDGFNFKVKEDVRELRFILKVDGRSRVDFVKIGAQERRPKANPFIVFLE